jgi:predicted transposase YdaD
MKEGRKEERKKGRKEERKKGRKEGMHQSENRAGKSNRVVSLGISIEEAVSIEVNSLSTSLLASLVRIE